MSGCGVHRIGCEENGRRLDAVLAGLYPRVSRSALQKLIASGSVSVNGRPARKSHLLSEGDVVAVDGDPHAGHDPDLVTPENIPLGIIYEDEWLLVVNKPAGLVVHPGSGNRTGTLVNALVYHVGDLSGGYQIDRPGIVHRLDKDTSGLLLVARNDRVHVALGAMFAQRRVGKTYLGVCVGRRPEEHATIAEAIGRSRRDPTRRAVRPDGKESVTEYRLLCHQSGVSLVQFVLHTGRTHQIRVHCRHAGFPIAGDATYGGDRSAVLRLQPLDRPFAASVHGCFARQALHARRLEFVHPMSEEKIVVEAPLPGDFARAVTLFGYAGDL